MSLKHLVGADTVCWMLLIAGVWVGPEWVSKVAITIIIMWIALWINWYLRNFS